MAGTQRFIDRQAAGIKLANQLEDSIDETDEVIVLALPRGGVPVAYEVAKHFQVPMSVLVVRKLGFPGHQEYAVGALAEGGMKVANKKVLDRVPEQQWQQILAREQLELERRVEQYRSGQELPDLTGKTVIIVDDGLATGATMLAAVKVVKKQQPERIIVAVPVGAKDTCKKVLRVVDEAICLRMPEPFGGVGAWYQSFPQTSDQTVMDLLSQARNKYNDSLR